MKMLVIYGSVREKRQGIRLAKYIMSELESRNIDAQLIDAKEYQLPFLDKRYFEFEGEVPQNIEKLHNLFDSSDAYIIVSGEYNHGLQPALKNMFDHYQSEFHFKPSGLATYSGGVFGGVRAAVHLRAVSAELGMSSIPTTLPVPSVGKNFDEEGNTENEHINKGFEKFINELLWYADALKSKRDKDGKL